MLGRYSAVFLACTLGIPTCCYILDGISAADWRAALVCGACLGVLHLFLRPVIRLMAAPIGCLTLGLVNPLIDLVLLYLANRYTSAIHISGIFPALMTVLLINGACLVAAGRS